MPIFRWDIPRNRSKSSADWKWWNIASFFRGRLACILNHYPNSGWWKFLGVPGSGFTKNYSVPVARNSTLWQAKKKRLPHAIIWRFPKILPKKHPKPDHSSCGDPPFWEPPMAFGWGKFLGFPMAFFPSHGFPNFLDLQSSQVIGVTWQPPDVIPKKI